MIVTAVVPEVLMPVPAIIELTPVTAPLLLSKLVTPRFVTVLVFDMPIPVPGVRGRRLNAFAADKDNPVLAVYPGEYPATEPVAEFTENAPEPEIEPTPVTAPFAVLNEVTPVFVMTLVELTPIPVPGVRGSREIVLPETPIPVPAVSEVIQVEHV